MNGQWFPLEERLEEESIVAKFRSREVPGTRMASGSASARRTRTGQFLR